MVTRRRFLAAEHPSVQAPWVASKKATHSLRHLQYQPGIKRFADQLCFARFLQALKSLIAHGKQTPPILHELRIDGTRETLGFGEELQMHARQPVADLG